MIPKDYVTEWRVEAPWATDAQVEQDLVLSRALAEIFRVDGLARQLAFRGGTSIYKLHLRPAARYSEDIDLVQTHPEPIGNTLSALRKVLDSWLGKPKRIQTDSSVKAIYRFNSEEMPPRNMRLKVEINSREHFTELGHAALPFEVKSRWWTGSAEITSFSLDELLGTKLRALYQRRKGRDLFDLWYGIIHGSASATNIVKCFHRYTDESRHRITRAMFEENLARKLSDELFRADISPLLRSGIEWDVDNAANVVIREVIARLPGDASPAR